MEFTREAWENAPEGARLEWSVNTALWEKVDLIGFTKANSPVIDDHGLVRVTHNDRLRITLTKRKVMVQLWRTDAGGFLDVRGWNRPTNAVRLDPHRCAHF